MRQNCDKVCEIVDDDYSLDAIALAMVAGCMQKVLQAKPYNSANECVCKCWSEWDALRCRFAMEAIALKRCGECNLCYSKCIPFYHA